MSDVHDLSTIDTIPELLKLGELTVMGDCIDVDKSAIHPTEYFNEAFRRMDAEGIHVAPELLFPAYLYSARYAGNAEDYKKGLEFAKKALEINSKDKRIKKVHKKLEKDLLDQEFRQMLKEGYVEYPLPIDTL